jgi:hypothetical protein
MSRCLIVLLLSGLLVPLGSGAQIRLFADELERVDVIAIERDGRDFFAFDSLTGRRAVIQLELNEEVFFQASRGRVGLVLTDRRALGVAPGRGWQEFRYRLKERAPEIGIVENRIAILTTDRRALGFNSRGRWVEERLSPYESAEAIRVGSAVAVVATTRRLLGLAAERNRFISIDRQLNETLESASAQDTLVSIRTNRRILVFAGPTATWSDQKRKIR